MGLTSGRFAELLRSFTSPRHLTPGAAAAWSRRVPGMCARRKPRSQRRARSVSARVITVTLPPTVTDCGPSHTPHNPGWNTRSRGPDGAGKGRSTLVRLYGPLEPWCDQTWRPGEIAHAPTAAEALPR